MSCNQLTKRTEMATATNQELKAIQTMIVYTDDRISTWYANAKQDYGVIGSGKVHYNAEENSVVVEYTENGVSNKWDMAFYPEYLENGIDWVFNCWSELA